MGQHRCTGADHDLIARELGHLLRHVRVTDHGFGVADLLVRLPQEIEVAFEGVLLKRPHVSPKGGQFFDGPVHNPHRVLGTPLGGHVNVVERPVVGAVVHPLPQSAGADRP